MIDELVGKKFDGYHVMHEIGRGGMAVVYKAQQISMNRMVAIKVLPRQFLHDLTFRARFDREVQVVSKLEHRAIVPVYDHGEVDEMPYIVMRYMDAGSVDDLLHQGPLPLNQVEKIVRQIAPGLDYAYKKEGVLHRDMKPSNILLDGNGDTYLTDFGIARIIGGGSTITTSGVVGTPSYMSPEQAQGLKLDGRSDVYALAVVIFEMLTGYRPYQAATPYSVAVMHVTAPVPSGHDINPGIPFAVDQVVQKGMAKNREARFPTAISLAEALTAAVNAPESVAHKTATRPIQIPPRAREPVGQVAPVPAPVRAADRQFIPTEAEVKQRSPAPTPPSSGRVAALSEQQPSVTLGKRRSGWRYLFYGGAIGLFVFGAVAFIVLLVLSSQQSATSMPITGSPTPDESNGGSSITLTEVPSLGFHPASVALTATAEFEAAAGTPISVIPTAVAQETQGAERTGENIPLTLDLAGGQIIFYASHDGDADIYLLDLATGLEMRLTNNDADDLFPVVSPDGSRIAFTSNSDGDYELFVMDIDGGNRVQLTRNRIEDRTPAWTPDGDFILFTSDINFNGEHIIYQISPEGSDLRAVTSGSNRDGHPSVSPDGRYLVYNSGDANNNDDWEIYRLDLVLEDVLAFTGNDYIDWSPSYSPDGSQILFHRRGDGFASMWIMDADGSNKRMVYDGAGYEWGSSWSPDGQVIAFTSNVTGDNEIYLTTLDGEDVRRITSEGGEYPSWVPE